jgi:hypothetical protein
MTIRPEAELRPSASRYALVFIPSVSAASSVHSQEPTFTADLHARAARPQIEAWRRRPQSQGHRGRRHGGVFLPVELIRKNHRGEREVSWRALFPAHLFVAIYPGRDLPHLLEIEGVDDVLRPSRHSIVQATTARDGGNASRGSV